MNLLQVRALVFTSVFLCASARARVVINEIFYHPPDDAEELEYVELHNASDQPADLSGWKFINGIKFQFPAGAKIEPRGYVVVARNRDRLKAVFGVEAIGAFDQSLKNAGERIELVNAAGEKIDSVKYSKKAPWPVSADGYSASLERISPSAPSNIPQNWAASSLPEKARKPTGTPGKQNARFSENIPPIISSVKFHLGNRVDIPSSVESPKSERARKTKSKAHDSASASGSAKASLTVGVPPDEPIAVEARITDSDGVREVKLQYRLAGPGFERAEAAIPMTKAGADRYIGAIPGQKAGQLIRFRIQAEDEKGARRFYPDEQEVRPTLSAYVLDLHDKRQIPTTMIIHVDETEFKAAERQGRGQGQGRQIDEEEQMRWMVWQQFHNSADLASVWYELTISEQLDFDRVRQLQPVFAKQKYELTKLVEQTTQAPQIREKLPEVPKLIRTFHSGLKEALKPILSDGQMKKFSDWQEQQLPQDPNARMRWTPERMLRQMLQLEASFLAASMQPDLTEPQFTKLKAILQSAMKERAKFVEPAKAASQGQGDWGKLQEDIGALDEKITKEASAVLTRDQEAQIAKRREEGFMPGRSSAQATDPPRGRSAFVYVDPKTDAAQVFDFVTATPRNAGYKVHFHRDQELNGMTGINLIFEYKDRFVLAEHLAYELYHRAGCPAPQSDHVQLTIDGHEFGYQLLCEQPNHGFLERNKIKTGGNMYKLLWFGRDVVGKHEKKTNPHTGHDDLVQLVDQLGKTKGDEQWEVIKKNFDVEEVINYFAVNMCLSHWDGFFNNYFTYHDTKGTGKWEMYPWDQDKTWGFHDSLGDDQIFWDMPITFGMEGDAPPETKGGRRFQGFNVGSWWRPPGVFSGPLLANPQFRKLYLARTKAILEKIYTPEVFFPIIDDLGKRLKNEVVLRAKTLNESPEVASQRLETNLQLFKDHLTKRREFLLKQDEIRTATTFSRAALN